MKLNEAFVERYSKAAPIIAVQSPNPRSTIDNIWNAAEAFWKEIGLEPPPLVVWDCVRGPSLYRDGKLYPENLRKRVSESFDAAFPSQQESDFDWRDPVGVLAGPTGYVGALALPKRSIVIMHNMSRFLSESVSVQQAVWNVRDPFAANGRCLVLMAPSFRLPPEVSQDTELIDESLPDVSELSMIINRVWKAFVSKQKGKGKNLKELDETTLQRSIDAVRGLSSFAAEQVVSLSLRPEGLDPERLWERKKAVIDQTAGLSIYRGSERFDGIGGLDEIKKYAKLILASKNAPSLIAWVDEIDKAGISNTGDSSGVNSDALGVLLTEMENNEWDGVGLVGAPGTTKSMFAKALGAEAGVPIIRTDFGAMKGEYVGQSEGYVRNAMKIIKAVGAKKVFFVATANSDANLDYALQRRFTAGWFYCDLPSREERTAIWRIHMKAYGLTKQAMPNDSKWTGAEIRNCCRMAANLGIDLAAASNYVLPVATRKPELVDTLRRKCAGHYLSVSTPGMYKGPESSDAEAPTGRMIDV